MGGVEQLRVRVVVVGVIMVVWMRGSLHMCVGELLQHSFQAVDLVIFTFDGLL